MFRVNMMSKADIVKGHGVLSAHDEQVSLVRNELYDVFEVVENGKIPCDIIHYHSINPELFLHARRHKQQGSTVGSVHFLPETVEDSIYLPGIAKKAFYKYMLSFYQCMDHLVTVNPYFIQALMNYGISKEKVTYIPNFVSEEVFYPLSESRKKETRKFYQLPTEAFTILCAGQMQKRKGVMEFIKIARNMPGFQFVWAGGFSFGKISDGYDEIKTVMSHAPQNVKFLGMIDREKMNEIYNMADVMFLPSFEELFPMTILEAMNCSIPILVRDLDIYKPILYDYVIKGKSNEEFQRILIRLMEDENFYQMASQAAFSGHQFYSRKHVSDMWREFYLGIVESNI